MRSAPAFRNLSLFALILAVGLSGCQSLGLTTPVPSTRLEVSTPVLPQTGEPHVIVSRQTSDGRSVVVDEVYSNGPGWVAIHIQENGQGGPAIGHARLNSGLNTNVVVELEPGRATETMYAMLHIDAGEVGTYEFPGADVPEAGDPQVVSPEFRVTLTQAGSDAPLVEVSDQAVVDGLVVIDRVVSAGSGWLVIYDDHGGRTGDAIGWTAVQAGENRDVQVQVDTGHMSPTLYAILHVDAGETGKPEFPNDEFPNEPDVRATFQGQDVLAIFTDTAQAAEEHSETQADAGSAAATPGAASAHGHGQVAVTPGSEPRLITADQDAHDGAVVIDEVFSVGPAWVVIYTEGKDGQPAERIGLTAVGDGISHDVEVKVDASRLTERLFAILHVDGGQIGTFEYPGDDQPVHIDIRMIQSVFASSLTAAAATTEQPDQTGLSVVIDDQPVRGGTIRVAEVVSDGPGWIGIHISNPDGTLSHSAIGAGHVDKGVNHDVIVRLTNPARATAKMFAMLHVDKGQLGVYEFPDPAIDVPVLVNGAELIDEFNITGGLAGQDVPINISSSGDTPYLVDGQGYSLYTLSLGECAGDCLKEWLPLLVTGKLVAGDGVVEQKLGIAALGDGSRQVTYGNLPLFYYIGDSRPGDTNGHGLDGQWFLGRP